MLAALDVTRYFECASLEGQMAGAAERMKNMRARRRASGLREIRISTPDALSHDVSSKTACQVAALNELDGGESLLWAGPALGLASRLLRSAMRRGDVVAVASTENPPRLRPAVIVQSDAFPAAHASVLICPMTSEIGEAPNFRVPLRPTESNGLPGPFDIMADRVLAVRRERIAQTLGRLGRDDIHRLNSALAFSTGLAD
jgi:mRNA interferase MazF